MIRLAADASTRPGTAGDPETSESDHSVRHTDKLSSAQFIRGVRLPSHSFCRQAPVVLTPEIRELVLSPFFDAEGLDAENTMRTPVPLPRAV